MGWHGMVWWLVGCLYFVFGSWNKFQSQPHRSEHREPEALPNIVFVDCPCPQEVSHWSASRYSASYCHVSHCHVFAISNILVVCSGQVFGPPLIFLVSLVQFPDQRPIGVTRREPQEETSRCMLSARSLRAGQRGILLAGRTSKGKNNKKCNLR